MKLYECMDCGKEFETDQERNETTCPYCGSGDVSCDEDMEEQLDYSNYVINEVINMFYGKEN